MLGAAAEADVLLVLTEWREFAEADPEAIGRVVAQRGWQTGGTSWTRRGGGQPGGRTGRWGGRRS